jgi:hypothetical protein
MPSEILLFVTFNQLCVLLELIQLIHVLVEALQVLVGLIDDRLLHGLFFIVDASLK